MFKQGVEDNLTGIFNLFDQDGNKMITLNELYELMSVFIEIAHEKENNLDLAKVMAEMFKQGDKNKDDVLELAEFKAGMIEHPVTGKILREKTLDACSRPCESHLSTFVTRKKNIVLYAQPVRQNQQRKRRFFHVKTLRRKQKSK